MRNVFDQYTQAENQLTHALACSLHEDQALLREFVRWLRGQEAPQGLLSIVEHVEVIEAKWGSTPDARPWILVQQRRALKGQRLSVWDAQIEFDPQTAVGLQSAHQVGNVLKVQPEWLQAVYRALTHKNANVEMCIGGRMEYGYAGARTPEFIDRVLDAWEATLALLRALRVLP